MPNDDPHNLIPELNGLSKAKRRRVTERAFSRALHLSHYFIVMGAVTFGATFVRPLHHAGTLLWLAMAAPVICGMVAGAVIIHRAVRRAERFAREDLGLACRGCGYDLRGSTWRCPECGKEFR